MHQIESMTKPDVDLESLARLSHLDDDDLPLEQLAERSSEVQQEVEDPKPTDPYADMREREHLFRFEYTTGSGKRFQGDFINQILTGKQRRRVAVIHAQLNNNVPANVMQPYQNGINFMMAHMLVSFVEKPSWFLSMDDDPEVEDQMIQALYEVVQKHEAAFHGSEPSAQPGA